MRKFCITLICLTSLPLFLYPFVLLANLMSFAASAQTSTSPRGLTIAMSGFLWSSSLYPVVYLTALIASIILLKRKSDKKALLWQIGLGIYLAVVVGFLIAWMNYDAV